MNFAPEHNLVFIQIPKNASQSVRNALRSATTLSYAALAEDLGVTEAEAEEAEDGEFLHPVLGLIKPSHLTLRILAAEFPACWATLSNATSFVITRDPRARFLSALLQRMKEFGGSTDVRAEEARVGDEAMAVCDWLSAHPQIGDLTYLHFTPQVDFTDLDGTRRVTEIFPVDRMDCLSNWLMSRTGLRLAVSHDHARRQPKSMARLVQPAVRLVSRSLMPRRVRRALYPLWTGSKLFESAADKYQTTRLGSDVEAFIKRFYAADMALHVEAHVAAEKWASAPASQ